ncbi:MAG: SpaA isopeptide-forming pilin-related protein [Sarcina sp.]
MKKTNLKRKLAMLMTGILCANMVWSNLAIAKPVEKRNSNWPAEMDSLGDYKTYNAVAWGNHTASGADIEGRLAVKGDINSPTETNSFDIGAAFAPGVGVGSNLEDEEGNITPGFLLGGDIINTKGNLQLCFGYGAMTFDNNPEKLFNGKYMKGTFIEDKENIDAIFNKIAEDINDKIRITQKLTPGTNEIKGSSFGIGPSKDRSDILVNKDGRDVSVFNVGNPVVESNYEEDLLPFLTGNQKMIIYSDAKEVNFNRGVNFIGKGEIGSGNPLIKTLAPKIVWVFPNAEKVTVFKNDVVGTVIAPKSNLYIHGGSINGQVFAKNINQIKKVIMGPNGELVGDRGEIHNFIFNWDIFDELKEKKGTLDLTKMDENQKLLENVEFVIKDKVGVEVARGITDKTGKVTFQDLLDGTYTYQEVRAPEGYVIDEKEYEFEIKDGNVVSKEVINRKIKSDVSIKKVDSKDKNITLQGAKFVIKNSEREIIREGLVTNADGIIEVGELTYGTYYYQEIEAPDGYILDNTEYKFEIKENGKTIEITVENTKEKPISPTPINGYLEITKLDADNKQILESAIFEIYKDGKLVDKGETNKDGKLRISNLENGKYIAKEVQAPDGYQIGINSEFEFEIKPDGKVYTKTVYNKKIANGPFGSIELKKIDKESKEPLRGATFAIKIPKNENIGEQDRLVAVGVTNEKGIVKFEDIPFGEYIYQEVEAPEGYVLDTTEYPITVEKNGFLWLSKTVDVTVTNEKIEKPIPPTPINGYLEITKVDADDEKKFLKGAEFTVYNDKNEEVAKGVTDEKGKIRISNLKDGKYTAVETKAPEGYELNAENKFEFELKAGNKVEQITVTNKGIEKPIPPTPINGYLEITKVDADDEKKFLKGAEFTIYNDKNEEVAKGVTDEKGKIRISNLKDGKYTAVETKAPEGYELNAENKFEFELKAGNKVHKEKVTNKKISKPEPPVDPEKPEPPVDPEKPEPPVDPEKPEPPVDPEKPEPPVDPEKPEPPVDPEKPEPPVDPEKPEPPVDPEKPEPPVDPGKPELPINPTKPNDKYPATSDEGLMPNVIMILIAIAGLFMVNKRKY